MKAYKGLTWGGFFLRLTAAFVLVFATYNPTEFSYFHWLKGNLTTLNPVIVLSGIVLLIGWTIFLRATAKSLGAFGLLLASAFFGTLVWLFIYWGLVDIESFSGVTYLILVVLCFILAVGISWSHIRRRITGQVDVDDVEGDV